MRKYLTEFIGTFFLVFTVCATVLGKVSVAPLAIGAVLMVMIFAGGHVSGAHYNPAVTLAVFLRGKLPAAEVVPYWVAQLLAAVLGSLLATFVINPGNVTALSVSGRGIWAALLAEFIFTFGLAYVVLNVATSRGHRGQPVLRPGHRLHGPGRRLRRRRGVRRRLQPGRGLRHHDRRAVVLEHDLDLPGRGAGRCRRGRLRVPIPQPERRLDPSGSSYSASSRRSTASATAAGAWSGIQCPIPGSVTDSNGPVT